MYCEPANLSHDLITFYQRGVVHNTHRENYIIFYIECISIMLVLCILALISTVANSLFLSLSFCFAAFLIFKLAG